MSDCDGFTLKHVRDIRITYSLYRHVYRKEKKLNVGQNLAISFF